MKIPLPTRCFLILFFSLSASISRAQDNEPLCNQLDGNCGNSGASVPTAPTQDQKNRTITEIDVRVLPIFDESKPEENNALFRLVNRLHINTHKGVIKHDLLVKEGQELDANALAESERILRTRHYFSEARVTAEPVGDNETKVTAEVHDVWTLFPVFNYSHRGGDSTYSFGLHDSNFLGYGKSVDILHKSDQSRTGNSFEYYDPNTGWHQTSLGLVYENNSDGQRRYISFIRPYFSLTTPNAMGVTYNQFEQEDSLYDAGDEVSKFGHDGNSLETFIGTKLSWSDERNIHRINLGYSRNQDTFEALPGFAETYPLPGERNFDTPWVEYQFVQDNYIEAMNINQINRIEDINLGWQASVRLGRVFSNSDYYGDGYQFSGGFEKAFAITENHLLVSNLNVSGMYLDSQLENGRVEGVVNYHWKNFERGQFFVGLEAARGWQLFDDQPLVLGGENGLRGYPTNYEMGDKRYLVNIEQRFYGQKEWFSLFHMGYAVFYDQGRAWGDSLVPQSQQDTLRDFGIGLRISGTRTGNRKKGEHNILHIDLATPLDGGSDISSLQWLVKVYHSF